MSDLFANNKVFAFVRTVNEITFNKISYGRLSIDEIDISEIITKKEVEYKQILKADCLLYALCT